MGSIFIFGSWVCEANDKGNLQGRLVEALEACEGLTLPTRRTEDLVEKLSSLTVSESTRALTTTSLDLTSGSDSPSESYWVLLKTSQVLFQLGSKTRHQSFKISIRTYFSFLPEN
jgi:hypothetical protein